MAFLVVSVMAGLGFASVGFLGFGAGFWAVILWYVAGCWAGFAACIGWVLIGGNKPSSRVAPWLGDSPVR